MAKKVKNNRNGFQVFLLSNHARSRTCVSAQKFLEAPLSHLQPGGILYLEVPLECEANGLISKVLNKERRLWAHEHINLYTPLSLRTLVETAGLRVLDLTVETIDFFWCKGPCLRLLASQ